LRGNTLETEVIISDYWTMMLLNPMSNKIWLTDGQYLASSIRPEYQKLLVELGDRIFKASNSSEAYSNLQTMAKDMQDGIDWAEEYYIDSVAISPRNITFLIVLSSRTVEWLESGSLDVMEPQYAPVNSSWLEVFNDTTYFIQLTEVSQQIYVFRLN